MALIATEPDASASPLLAQQLARGVSPIAMWRGIATEPDASTSPLLASALGWPK